MRTPTSVLSRLPRSPIHGEHLLNTGVVDIVASDQNRSDPYERRSSAVVLESLDDLHRLFAHRKRVLDHDCINVTMPQRVHQVKVLIEGDQCDVILPPKTAQRKHCPACLGDADRYDGRQFWICPEHGLCLLFRLTETEGALRLSYQLDARKSAFQCSRERLSSCRGTQHI